MSQSDKRAPAPPILALENRVGVIYDNYLEVIMRGFSPADQASLLAYIAALNEVRQDLTVESPALEEAYLEAGNLMLFSEARLRRNETTFDINDQIVWVNDLLAEMEEDAVSYEDHADQASLNKFSADTSSHPPLQDPQSENELQGTQLPLSPSPSQEGTLSPSPEGSPSPSPEGSLSPSPEGTPSPSPEAKCPSGAHFGPKLER